MTISTALRAYFYVSESTFSIEKFLRFAVGFRWKDQDASRARIFSWSEHRGGHQQLQYQQQQQQNQQILA